MIFFMTIIAFVCLNLPQQCIMLLCFTVIWEEGGVGGNRISQEL